MESVPRRLWYIHDFQLALRFALVYGEEFSQRTSETRAGPEIGAVMVALVPVIMLFSV